MAKLKPFMVKTTGKNRHRRRRERVAIPPDKKWITKLEAADESTLSVRNIERHLKALGARKVGGRVIIERARLHEWLRSQPAA